MQNKLFQEHLNVRTKDFDIGHLCSSSVTRGGGLYRHSTVVYTERALAPQSYIYIYAVTVTPPHPPPPHPQPPTSQNSPIMLIWAPCSKDWPSPSSLPSVRRANWALTIRAGITQPLKTPS